MKAIRITERGGPEVLRVEEVPDPVPARSEVLVRVRAFALNRADLLQCLGLYPAPPGAPADIPGLEYAGEVLAVGGGVRRHRVGDRVMGIVGGGAYAERLVTHEREAVPIPPPLDFVQAAAIPEAFFTAFDALVQQAGLRSGERVLIHAAASGVGSAAGQIASAVGAHAIGTVRSTAKVEACLRLGFRHVLVCDREALAFAPEVRSLTNDRGVDVILDLVGGDYFGPTLEVAAERARWMLVGLLGGAAAPLNLAELMRKRIRLVGTVLRSRPIEEKIALAQAFERQLLPLFVEGRLAPVVDRQLPAARVAEAFGALAANQPVGKIVLTWD